MDRQADLFCDRYVYPSVLLAHLHGYCESQMELDHTNDLICCLDWRHGDLPTNSSEGQEMNLTQYYEPIMDRMLRQKIKERYQFRASRWNDSWCVRSYGDDWAFSTCDFEAMGICPVYVHVYLNQKDLPHKSSLIWQFHYETHAMIAAMCFEDLIFEHEKRKRVAA